MGYRDIKTGIDGTCLGCQDRYPACHDTCEKYLEAKASWENKKQIIRDARDESRVYDNYKLGRIIRERKKGTNSGKTYKWTNKKG